MLLRLGRAPLFLQCRQLLAAALLSSSLRALIASTNQRQIQERDLDRDRERERKRERERESKPIDGERRKQDRGGDRKREGKRENSETPGTVPGGEKRTEKAKKRGWLAGCGHSQGLRR